MYFLSTAESKFTSLYVCMQETLQTFLNISNSPVNAQLSGMHARLRHYHIRHMLRERLDQLTYRWKWIGCLVINTTGIDEAQLHFNNVY